MKKQYKNNTNTIENKNKIYILYNIGMHIAVILSYYYSNFKAVIKFPNIKRGLSYTIIVILGRQIPTTHKDPVPGIRHQYQLVWPHFEKGGYTGFGLSVISSVRPHNFISTQYLENILIEYHQILCMHSYR